MTMLTLSSTRFSRRALVGSAMAGAALLPLPSVKANAGATATAGIGSRRTVQAIPAGWRMWVLDAPDELRPDAPGSPGDDEVAVVVKAQADADDAMTAAIKKWGTGPAVLPWSAMTPDLHTEFLVSGMRQSRNLALLHAAMHDAAIAALDAQAAYGRPGPAATSDAVTPAAGVDPTKPSFPSEHAAVAGAAAAVLVYLFPDAEAGRFDALAQQAGASRIAAGAAFPSDVEVGLALGQAVGARAIERGTADGSDAKFDPATIPTGPGFWQPTPPNFAEVPVEPLGGAWTAWVLERNDQFRPVAPPTYKSPTWVSEMEQVLEAVARRTFQQESVAQRWQKGGGYPQFTGWAHELILRDGLDLPHAARVLAYLNAAYADAVIAVWDAKYTWWTSRPITEDPDLAIAFPTPNYPAYPSGFSAVAGVGATVLGHFFSEAATDLNDRSWEATQSRCWAGIHYSLDNEVGLTIGRRVGRLFTSLAGADDVDDAG